MDFDTGSAASARLRLRTSHAAGRIVGSGLLLVFGLALLAGALLWIGPSMLRLAAEQEAWTRGRHVSGKTVRWKLRTNKGILHTHEIDVVLDGPVQPARPLRFEFMTLFVRAARTDRPEVALHPERSDVLALGPAMDVIAWRWAAAALLLGGLLLGGGACTWGAVSMLRDLSRLRRVAWWGQPVLLELLERVPPAAKQKHWTYRLRAPDGVLAEAKFRPPRKPLWIDAGERTALGLHWIGSGLAPLVVRNDLHPLKLSATARDALLETLRAPRAGRGTG
jgi:hypothetical protein